MNSDVYGTDVTTDLPAGGVTGAGLTVATGLPGADSPPPAPAAIPELFSDADETFSAGGMAPELMQPAAGEVEVSYSGEPAGLVEPMETESADSVVEQRWAAGLDEVDGGGGGGGSVVASAGSTALADDALLLEPAASAQSLKEAEELDEAAEELLLAVTKDDDTEAEKMNAGQQAEGDALESVAATGVTAALIATADVTEPVLTDATVIVADAVSTDAIAIVADSVSTDAIAIVADAVSTDATAIVADAVSTDATAIVADAVSTDATAIVADAVSTDATAIVADSISTGITADATVIKTDESIEDVQEATLADVTTTITDASSAGVTESVNGDKGVGAELEQAGQPADVSVVVNGQTTSDVDTGVGDTQIDPQDSEAAVDDVSRDIPDDKDSLQQSLVKITSEGVNTVGVPSLPATTPAPISATTPATTPTKTVTSPATLPASSPQEKTAERGPQLCIVCKKINKCKYNIVRNGDIKHLCNDACFKLFRSNPTTYLTKTVVSSRSLLSKSPAGGKASAAAAAAAAGPKTPPTCAFCRAVIATGVRDKFTLPSRGGAGDDVNRFCRRSCLTHFQSHQKPCAFCRRDVTRSADAFMAPAGAGFKDFCNRKCLQRYEEAAAGDGGGDASQDVEFVGTSRVTGGPRSRTKTSTCQVCGKVGRNMHEVMFNGRTNHLCSDPCFTTFRQSNKLSMSKCEQCGVACCSDSAASPTSTNAIQYEGRLKRFCGSVCLDAFKAGHQRMVACAWCSVSRSNFDMIERVDADNQCQLFCTLNCLSLYRVNLQATSNQSVACDQCRQSAPAQYHLTMSDASVRNFCSYACVMAFQGQFNPSGSKTPAGSGTATSGTAASGGKTGGGAGKGTPSQPRTPAGARGTPQQANKGKQAAKATKSTVPATDSIGVISNVVSLAASSSPAPALDKASPVLNRLPVRPKQVKNKALLCKPFVQTKATSCRPVTQTAGTQTETIRDTPHFIPIPIPIYVPVPMAMYSLPVPHPLPIPIPIPIPCFIPTTKNSADAILKTVKEIRERMPADPFEAEMLMMAEAVATEGKTTDSEESEESDDDAPEGLEPEPVAEPEKDAGAVEQVSSEFAEDMLQMALRMATEMPADDSAISIEPSNSVPTETEGVDSSADSEAERRGSKRRASGTPGASKRRKATSSPAIVPPAAPSPEKPSPDANMVLKYMFGVNAWRQWVAEKNRVMQAEWAGGGEGRATAPPKPHKTELLQCTADELNFQLCLFISEVRKANGELYSPDSVYYLCLGIQQYLFENNRIDNIFTDSYFERFTDSLNDLLQKYEVRLNVQGLIVCRIEEEHLWESKQLGAHSPHVLLNTLIYFNTRFFYLRTAQDHLALSFSHIMKHWKKTNLIGTKTPGRSVYLRYYAPINQTVDSSGKRKKEDVPVYEQGENIESALRCPVKLYEFYLSKCPESIKNRNDVFYLVPERSCVPDSPVWYSTASLGVEPMSKMLNRVALVREIQEMNFQE